MKNKALLIIPARGGSKRIPRKNIRNFLGQPIIKYSIDTAFQSGIFDEVMVSTEDKEISEVVKDFSVSVPFLRSVQTASDSATTAAVVLEVLEEYKKLDKEFEYVCCLYATAPFVTSEKLNTAFNILKENGADSVFSIVKFDYKIQRALRVDDGLVKMVWPENMDKRSQDLEENYHDAGQFYFMKTNSFLQQHKIFAEKSLPLIVDEMEVQDIDNEADWKMAELKYKILHKLA